jgi:hypothetical protein
MPETVIIQTPTDQDEIVISLTEHKSVTHDTVRINVTVNAQRDSTASETDFRNKIRAVLGNFIPSAEWRFTSVNRQRGQTRFEQVVVSAVTRVKESENVQLAERANSASEQGMEIVGPQAHFAFTTERVREINRELRIALVKQAQEECNEYNKSRGDYPPYRVALIEFADTPRLRAAGDTSGMYATQNLRASAAYAQSNAAGSAGGGGVTEPDVEEGSSELGVQERFWVAAQVILRANRA